MINLKRSSRKFTLERYYNNFFLQERLKFDITLGANLKKLILKRINYNKESSDLKANTKVDNNLSVNNPEAGSWRKKSNDGEE